MLRSLASIQINVGVIPLPAFCQCVRWKTKPRWVPVAKSKLFRIPERKSPPEEEKLEIQRLTNKYNTEVRSLRHYIIKTHHTKVLQNKLTQSETVTEEIHHKCMEENAAWNSRIALIREARLAKQAEDAKEAILVRLIQREENQKKRLEKMEQIVREEKLRAHTYITAENVDHAIEEALANPVDPNFAIDLDGNVYHGRDTHPENVQGAKIQSSSAL